MGGMFCFTGYFASAHFEEPNRFQGCNFVWLNYVGEPSCFMYPNKIQEDVKGCSAVLKERCQV